MFGSIFNWAPEPTQTPNTKHQTPIQAYTKSPTDFSLLGFSASKTNHGLSIAVGR
jgi:hypothetical protein